MVPRFSEKKRDRYISDDEYTRLIEAASPTLSMIINMAYLTGQRIGDVLNIKQSDTNTDGITVIREKTGKKTLARISHQDHGSRRRIRVRKRRSGAKSVTIATV